MADATGTPTTNFSFPTINTSVDAPSGQGENTIITDVDTKLNANTTNLGAIARSIINKAGALVGKRRAVNFIEGTGITLTIADNAGTEAVDVTVSTSGGLVSTTVAGLGAGSDGKVGLIRAGTTPFDFVPVTYDATYSKWISNETVLFRVTGGTTGGATDLSFDNINYPHALIPHKPFTDAGLTLQVLVNGVTRIGANTLTVGVSGFPQNDGDTAAGTVQHVDAWSHTSAVYIYKVGSWISLAPATPKSMLALTGTVRQNTGANTIDGEITVLGRWVG